MSVRMGCGGLAELELDENDAVNLYLRSLLVRNVFVWFLNVQSIPIIKQRKSIHCVVSKPVK